MDKQIKFSGFGDNWVGIVHPVTGRTYKVKYKMVDDPWGGEEVRITSCNPKLIAALGRKAIAEAVYLFEA